MQDSGHTYHRWDDADLIWQLVLHWPAISEMLPWRFHEEDHVLSKVCS
jgi:hypothetical protein